MKGVIGILGLVIAMMGLIIIVLFPSVSFQISATGITEFEYKNNNAQLTLLSSLYSTHVDEDGKLKSVSEIIAEFITLSQKPDLGFLKNNPNIAESNLYSITSSSLGTIATGKDTGKNYPAKTKLPLPYNPDPKKLFDELILVID